MASPFGSGAVEKGGSIPQALTANSSLRQGRNPNGAYAKRSPPWKSPTQTPSTSLYGQGPYEDQSYRSYLGDEARLDVPGLLADAHTVDGAADSDDYDDDEIEQEHMRSLVSPQLPSIEHDFRLCNACYTTSKELGYLNIGGPRWESLLAAEFGQLCEPVSCCVLGAVIYHTRKKRAVTIGSLSSVPIPALFSADNSFGSKMADIFLFSDEPILFELSSSLKKGPLAQAARRSGFVQTAQFSRSQRRRLPVPPAPKPRSSKFQRLDVSRLFDLDIKKKEMKKWDKFKQDLKDATLRTVADIACMRDINGSHVNLSLVRTWLDFCERSHSSCADLPRQAERAPLPLLLIDVKDRKLVEASTDSRYLALSYVWGGACQYKATTDKLATLKTKGSLRLLGDEIPQVIKDAIDFVNSIGEKWLWVDALSITHDDEQQKHHQIAQMASVYHQAVLTIVALGGKDASACLPGFRVNSRCIKGMDVVPGVRLCQRTRNLSDLISRSVYDTRAWTYQERLLSKRCVFFTEEQVYFQCGTSVCCEDRKEPIPHDHMLVAPLASSMRLDLSARNNVLSEAFPYYAQFVLDYSRKQLSYQSDVINAFTGITRMLEQHWDWRFLQALPVPLIDLALLWALSTTTTVNDAESQRRQEIHFPSWSWVGWNGGVDYALVPKTGLRSKLESVYLEDTTGCYEATDRIPEFSTSRIHSEQERDNPSDPENLCQSPGEKAKILHFKAFAVPANKFQFHAANKHYYFTEGHIFRGVIYQRTSLILDGEGHHCGTLYGIEAGDVEKLQALEPQFVLLSATLRNSRTLHYADPDATLQQPGLRPDPSGQSGHYEGKVYDESNYNTGKLNKAEQRWSTLNILLVSSKGVSEERLAIGQIHISAWKAADPVKRHVKLI